MLKTLEKSRWRDMNYLQTACVHGIMKPAAAGTMLLNQVLKGMAMNTWGEFPPTALRRLQGGRDFWPGL